MLKDYRCHQVILIQPEERKKQKTDRRDAAALSELLWVNRARLLQGKPVRGLRQVDISSTTDQENRRLTTLRKSAGQAQTRIILKIKHMLRRYNLQWEMPTKTFPTQRAIAWLKKLALPEIDRWEMDHLLADLEHAQRRVEELKKVIAQRSTTSDAAALLATTPGVGAYTAIALASRVGRVERFPRSHSLANYWGLTPAVAIAARPGDREVSPRPAAPRHGGYWANDSQGVGQRCSTTGVVQTYQTPTRLEHRPGGRHEKLATTIWHMLTKKKTYAECRGALAS